MMIHVCQSIDGALKNWTEAQWKRVAKDNGFTVRTTKLLFKRYLDEGKEVIPLWDGQCSNFDYKKGCLGHLESEK